MGTGQTFWAQEVERRIREAADLFTQQQIASGRIHPDSVAAMGSADLRAAFTGGVQHTEEQVLNSEQQKTAEKQREAATREADLRTAHALSKPASAMTGEDKAALRSAVAQWLRENGQ